MKDDCVLCDNHGNYVELTLNRPDKLNSFNAEQHRQLRQALEAAADDPDCRAILLTGAGRGFCAGQDLADDEVALTGAVPDLGMTIETYYNPLVRLMRSIPKPIVCAVNGVAAGAGANIALACDIVLAAKSAKFIQAFSKIALVPDSGGTYWLTRFLGEARAKALAITGEPVTAEKAADWGMIWKALDDEVLMQEARALCASLSSGPTYSYGLIKQAIQQASINSLDAQLDMERDLQRKAALSDDFIEGVNAFLEKRPASFTGRKRD